MIRFDRRFKIPTWIGAIVLAGVLASCGLPDTTDTTAPTVLETTPSSGAIAPTNEPVTATFDEAIDVATLTTSFTLTSPGNMLVAGNVSFDTTTNTATFTPTNALAFDTTYTATLSTDITDVAGNALEQPVTWTFTTEAGEPDTSAPAVLVTTPSGAGLAPTNQPVTVTFDEAIDVSTLTTSSFTLTGPGGTPVDGGVTFDATTNTAIFTPTNALDSDTTYTATLSTDITDLAGNALDQPVTWTFTTDTVAASIDAVELGTAGDFVLLSKAGISTTGTTLITGDIGVSPIALTAITGFDATLDASGTFATSDLVVGRVYAANLTAPTPTKLTTAIGDMETAYTDAAGRTMPDSTELGSGNIGSLTIEPGLHTWSTAVAINTDLTLTGSATDVWILQIAQDLTLASNVSVLLAGGALPENVFWQVAGEATLGTGSVLNGIVLSKTAIVMSTGATLIGRGYAQTEITLDATTVTQP